jgi:hypothetical protein
MERLTLRITRPDFTIYEVKFTNAKVWKDETGISIIQIGSSRLLAFYPLRYCLEIVE